MLDFIELLWTCYHDIIESALSFDDMENVDEGLENDFNLVYEDR